MTANELVVNTLFDREPCRSGSCFVVNVSGMKLLRKTEEVLPEIEDVVKNIVEPSLVKQPSGRQFRGLDYVLGAYLVIGSKYCPERMIEFLGSRSKWLQAEAIAGAPSFFRVVDGSYIFGTPPAPELLGYIERAKQDVDEHVRSAAEGAATFLSADSGGENRRD